MKFKKVGIQAFRAYDKLEDGTFNFSCKNDKPANFISIYAPNGFGKTSFYDAVEYGMTNSISRLIKKHSINKNIAKNERSINEEREGNLILRNRNSDKNLEAFVSIQTDGEEPFKRTIPKPKTINSSDFHFKTEEVVNDYFQTVVLSQEWIDAFLREDQPEERYRKFIEYFGDNEMDLYYNKITNLLDQNDKNIKALKKDLIGIQKELDFSGDKEILKTVNSKIEELNEKGEKLNRITNSHSENESVEFSNTISRRVIDLESEIQNIELNSQAIETALIGNKISSFEDYYKNITSHKSNLELEKKLKNKLILFKVINEKQNEIRSIKESKEELFKPLNKINEYISLLPKYTSHLKRLKEKEIASETTNKELKIKEEVFSKTKEQNSKESIQVEGLKERINVLEKKLKEIPVIKEAIKRILKDLSSLKSTDDVQQEIDSKEKELKINEESKKEFLNLINDIKQNKFLKLINTSLLKYDKEVLILKKTEETLWNKQNEIGELNIQIKEHQIFENEIESFISKGIEIVNNKKLDVCPLCTQGYDKYSELSEKISENKFLSNINSSLLNRQSKLKQEFDKIDNDLSGLKEGFIEKLEKEIEVLDLQTLALTQEFKQLKGGMLNLEKRKNDLTQLKKENDHKLNYKEADAYENELSKELKDSIKEFENLLESKKYSEKIIRDYNNEIEVLRSKLLQFKNECKELKNNEIAIVISGSLNLSLPSANKAEELLSNKAAETNKNINILFEKEKTLNEEIEKLKMQLKSVNKEELEETLTRVQTSLDSLQKTINTYEIFLYNHLDIRCDSMTRESLKTELDKKQKLNKVKVKSNSDLIQGFKLLSSLKANVEPYLKYEEAVAKEKGIIERVEFLQGKVKNNLQDEKNKVADYIHKLVESFFYEELINDIYQRIDPHPDYTSIKFICDFSGSKPKLNVCAYKKEDEKYIIPNLYFSTAQLNIMSMSIFLAKALNAKDAANNDVNCILIDDPIQSMDSINILSTIDLLRSLVVNHEKQIIISTHDENFHNLLKKKIPVSLYNSKYFELETFGKVKD